jgi:hypothetical protein
MTKQPMFKEGLEMIPDGGVLPLVTGGAKGDQEVTHFIWIPNPNTNLGQEERSATSNNTTNSSTLQ